MKVALFFILLLIGTAPTLAAQKSLPVKRIVLKSTTGNLTSLTEFQTKYDALMSFLFSSKEGAGNPEPHPEESSMVSFVLLTTDATLFSFTIVSHKDSRDPSAVLVSGQGKSARIPIAGFHFPDA
jgi:hypothetical protein